MGRPVPAELSKLRAAEVVGETSTEIANQVGGAVRDHHVLANHEGLPVETLHRRTLQAVAMPNSRSA